MHLVLDVSGHGYGHLAQCAVVLPALRRRVPNLRVTVRSAIDPGVVRAFLGENVDFAAAPPDPGLIMHDPERIDVAASIAAYGRLRDGFERTVEADAVALGALAPDLLLANVAFVGIAAAARLGLPSTALCSINWYDVVRAYDPARRLGDLAVIRDAYRCARTFIVPEPGLPMTFLGEGRLGVGPFCRRGERRPAALREGLGVGSTTRLVLVSWGGISGNDTFAWLPRRRDVCWLVPLAVERDDVVDLRRLPFAFADLVASVDAVVAKPGYGLFCEAAAAGTPVVYTARPDWPETTHLAAWLERHVTAVEIDRRRDPAELARALDTAFAAPRGVGAIGDGTHAAAAAVLAAAGHPANAG